MVFPHGNPTTSRQERLHRGLTCTQAVQRDVSVRQRESFEVSPYRHLRCDNHEIRCVFPCQIRHGADLPFAPEQFVGELRNIAHVYAAANDNAALAERAQRLRHQTADRSKNNCRVKHQRGQFIGISSPDSAEKSRKLLSFTIAGSCKRINLPALIDGHLGHQMSRGTESVDPDPPGVAGFRAGTENRSVRRTAAVRPLHRNRTRNRYAEPFICGGESEYPPSRV